MFIFITHINVTNLMGEIALFKRKKVTYTMPLLNLVIPFNVLGTKSGKTLI